jgi:Pyridine nucleotide-disulphide oxidoreductase
VTAGLVLGAVTSDSAIAFPAVQGRLLIDGGGAIGPELGSVWSRLGSSATVVEVLDHVLAGMDREIADCFAHLLQEQGITLKLGSKVAQIEQNGELINVAVEPAEGAVKPRPSKSTRFSWLQVDARIRRVLASRESVSHKTNRTREGRPPLSDKYRRHLGDRRCHRRPNAGA